MMAEGRMKRPKTSASPIRVTWILIYGSAPGIRLKVSCFFFVEIIDFPYGCVRPVGAVHGVSLH
jgi:hypothetical protein